MRLMAARLQQTLSDFVEAFRTNQWPDQRLPELFYDPRSLLADPARASLHAKCVVMDKERALISLRKFHRGRPGKKTEAGFL